MPRASLVRASLGRAEFERAALQQFTADNAISVVSRGLLTSEATFTRADPATYFDSDGLLQTASAGEARTTYIGGVPYLLMEGEATEISGRSFDLDNWTTVAIASAVQDAVGLDGENNTGWTVTDDDNASSERIQQNTSITSGTSVYYLVLFIKKDASPSVYPLLRLRLTGGTGVIKEIVFDPSDGTHVDTSNTTAGTDITLDSIQIGEHWCIVLECTDNGSGNNTLAVRIHPAWNTNGTASLENAAQGSTEMGYAGVFQDNFSLMPIFTTGNTPKTVAADVASLANSVISGLTEGTLYMEIWTPQLTSNAARHIAELESDSNNLIRVLHAADGDLDAQITDGGVSQAALAGTDLTVGTLQKVALAFAEDDFALYRDGTQEATDSGGTVPSVDTLLIGAGLYGGIKTMNVYTSRLPNAQLASMTT